MKTFKDESGRTWTIDVNVDSIEQVRAATGVNFYESFDGAVFPSSAEEGSILQLLPALSKVSREGPSSVPESLAVREVERTRLSL